MITPQATPRIVLVTGATNGIGKVTALELARAGYRVLLTSRDAAKGRRVLDEIRTRSGNDALELFVGDLSSMTDVRRIALEVRERHSELDVLINNAGGLFTERTTTVDGFETTFAFNHLAYFLLTTLLLEPLKAAGGARVLGNTAWNPAVKSGPSGPARVLGNTAHRKGAIPTIVGAHEFQPSGEAPPSGRGPARVVSVSSAANRLGRMRWDDLEFRRGYSGYAAYNQSKLMNVLFSNALARRLHGTGVTSNALHPGAVRSGFNYNPGGLIQIVFSLTKLFLITPEQGAQTSLYLATSPEVEGVSGHYFVNKKQKRANPTAYDEAAQERLWALSEHLLSRWLDPVESAPVEARA